MANLFKLKILSPNRIFYEGEVEMIELTTTEGDIGVYAGHVPLTSIIAPGIMKITEANGEIKEATMMDGFLEILPETVTILSESCEWPEEIDAARANEAKIRAERRLAGSDTNININRAEIALKKSLIRLGLSEKR